MKKKIVSIVCIITLITALITLTGCKNTPRRSVSFVLGAHRYFPKPNLNTQVVYDEVYKASESYGSVSATIIDGDPYLGCSYEIKKPRKDIDEQKKRQIAEENARLIIDKLASLNAETPEIDTLGAITLAANSLNGGRQKDDKTMIIIDSGLSTESLLDFANKNIIDNPTENTISQIKSLKAIPDLRGINIKWIGLGNTCGKQQRLSARYVSKLKELWNRILELGGAKTIFFDTTPVTGNCVDEKLPSCTTVPVVEESLKVSAQNSVSELPEVAKYDDDSKVRFKADKSEFVNPKDVKKELEPIAKYLRANEDKKLYIFGMTATVLNGDNGVELSRKRAKVCRNILIDQGVNSKQLICRGLGHINNPLRVKDVDSSGKQIEKMAKKNRAVVFIRADSDLIMKMLD